MTTLYRPVPIESAEQAEALPVGTIALVREYGEETSATKTMENLWRVVDRWYEYDDEEAVGWTALVPIEAEEEFTAMGTDDGEPWIAHVGRDGIDGSREEAQRYVDRFGGFIAHRALTPWEEA